MSASSTPTSLPDAASAAAMLTVSDDLPTPPLPDAIAITRVAGESWIPRVSTPPRRRVVSAARSSGLITSKWSSTLSTPGSDATCWCTWSSKLDRSGQPATVSAIVTSTRPPSSSTPRTISSSVTGRRSSGSITFPSAARISSRLAMRRGYRVEQQPRGELGIEERRLLGHRLARVREPGHLLERDRLEQEGGRRLAPVDGRDG